MRGEHGDGEQRAHGYDGSSPHARGAQVLDEVCVRVQGIIPACAGSTICLSGGARRSRDHPRMRGEHVQRFEGVTFARGSSPHARGAHGGGEEPAAVPGIIPACAGSTICAQSCKSFAKDHPRMRGEHDRIKRG